MSLGRLTVKKCRRKVLLFVSILLVSCIPDPDENGILKWRGMCIPDSHISIGGAFGFMYHYPSSSRIRLRIPSEEIQEKISNWKANGWGWEGQFVDELVTVSVMTKPLIPDSNANAYRDFLVEEILSNEAAFFEVEISELPALKGESVLDDFFLFKHKISADEARSLDPIFWLKAHCFPPINNTDRGKCFASRSFNEFSYEFSLGFENVENLEEFENLIHEYLKNWKYDCKKAT